MSLRIQELFLCFPNGFVSSNTKSFKISSTSVQLVSCFFVHSQSFGAIFDNFSASGLKYFFSTLSNNSSISSDCLFGNCLLDIVKAKTNLGRRSGNEVDSRFNSVLRV